MAFAHSCNEQHERQDLLDHLRSVGECAAEFAGPLGAGAAGRFLGLCHDIGKFSPEFQRYLLESEANPKRRGHGPDHKGAGAILAAGVLGPLALAIQGHHGGLHSPAELKAWLVERQRDPLTGQAIALAMNALPELQSKSVPLPAYVEGDALAAEMFIRLLFSALVDADFLDTERHFSPTRPLARSNGPSLSDLWARLARDQKTLSGWRSDAVGQARHAIYQACLAAAERAPGLFRLTVPTGGGKTRSAMAFALRHALLHGQQRVIVAIPFISITEQTADVYRRIFEDPADAAPVVLEHHSAAITDEDDEWARLAAENWDAPIVVTTTVQLFESLFADNPSRCRKLHRLANSVLILDEAQALPPGLLTPCLDALAQLAAHYGTTVVLSTATQPAFEAIPAFRQVAATEIVPEPGRYFDALRRVSWEWRSDSPLSWLRVAEIMRGERQALAVVNTKRDALNLLDALADPDALHLSTLLCGAHRRRAIAEVRRRLTAGEPCRLVSTQVIEAGVDLDFPVMLRALGPLDALIQAAGRCNREGRLDHGRVLVFAPAEGHVPPGSYRTATGVTQAILARGGLDLSGPEAPWAYFEELFHTLDTDSEHIQPGRQALDYPGVAERFKLIRDDSESVAVRYGTVAEIEALDAILTRLRRGEGRGRHLLRALQPYLVTVRRREAERWRRNGMIAPVAPGLGEWLGEYDPVLGLSGADLDPEALII